MIEPPIINQATLVGIHWRGFHVERFVGLDRTRHFPDRIHQFVDPAVFRLVKLG
jgi:hypothetical protein